MQYNPEPEETCHPQKKPIRYRNMWHYRRTPRVRISPSIDPSPMARGHLHYFVTELDPFEPKKPGIISGFMRIFNHRGHRRQYAVYGSTLFKGTLWFEDEDAAIFTLLGLPPL